MFGANTPVFQLRPEAPISGVMPLAWFDSANPLRSGWALGQKHLQHGIVAVQAPVGKGTLVLLSPDVTFRGQAHASFKLLFNAILYGSSEPRARK
jgi:hypothetical protein